MELQFEAKRAVNARISARALNYFKFRRRRRRFVDSMGESRLVNFFQMVA